VLPVDEPLPETKAALYERFTRYFYEWKQEQRPTTRTERRQLNQALGELAKAGINSKARFRLGEGLACDVMGEPLFDLACRLGWLNLVDREAKTDEAVYAFFHPTFQEYFAACAIDDWRKDFLNHVPDNPMQGTYRIFEPQWKEVILLWLGRPHEEVAKGQKEEFIKALVKFEDSCNGFYWYKAVFLAAAGTAEIKEQECELSDEIIAKLIKWNFGYFHAEKIHGWIPHPIEDGARTALQESNRIKVIANLKKQLYVHQEQNTCWQFAEGLGEIDPGNPEAISTLVELLQSTQDERLRILAAESLGKIDSGNLEAINTLIEFLYTHPNEALCLRIAENLAKIDRGNPEAIKALAKLLHTGKDEGIRSLSASKLGEIGLDSAEAITALVNFILNSQNEFARHKAFESLGKIGIGNLELITVLINRLLGNQDQVIRREAVWCIGEIAAGNSEAIDILINFLNTDQYESIHWLIVESLGKIGIGNSQVIKTLVELLDNSSNEWTHQQAAESLWKLDSESTKPINALINLLHKTRNERIRRRTIKSLEKIGIGNQKAIKALVNFLHPSQDEWTCLQAAESLGKIDPGNPKAIKFLIQLLHICKDEPRRREIICRIGTIGIGNTEAINAVTEVLRNTQNESILQYEQTLWYAARSLERALKSSSSPAVVAGLKECIQEQVYKNDFERFRHCYSVLWHCAQNMTYPDFYEAWHQTTI
jgi:HEAT repeat protein